MLAAVGGVLFTLATVLKLQGYSAYVQPMPIVVAAMRWGPAAGRKAMTATCFLLLGKGCLPCHPYCCWLAWQLHSVSALPSAGWRSSIALIVLLWRAWPFPIDADGNGLQA